MSSPYSEHHKHRIHSPNQRQSPSGTMNVAEKTYWRNKLPLGFQYYLERMARSIIRGMPENVYEFAAVYLEEKLVERNAEIQRLPDVTYFDRLKKKHAPPPSEEDDISEREGSLQQTDYNIIDVDESIFYVDVSSIIYADDSIIASIQISR
ncbi:uncharacterized protein [Haliotis cracherodii]|uniref:uncharacterized protein n=1 Tax=Haliotis cracherodii TaxID=6455 RepID=UPI0039ECE726